MKSGLIYSISMVLVLVSGCTRGSVIPQATLPEVSPGTTITSAPSITPTSEPITITRSVSPTPLISVITVTVTNTEIPSPQATATYTPGSWMTMPILPELNGRLKEIYQHGMELGNNPKAFSKIGDCGSTPAWFLGDFDRGEKFYKLGNHQNLTQVIHEFQGSYDRTSLAAKSGFNASSIFAPIWANKTQCQADEGPLVCEYRVHRPAFAFIMLGSNDIWHPDEFEPQMRKLIEFSIEQGVIPILSTKADNLEEDGSINDVIARLSVEYGVPLWNYWLAVQPLPKHGLQKDMVHITWGPNRFDDPQVMKAGWPVRNLTALQVLDAVWRFVATP